MQLYFVAAVDQNDIENNLDLFVWADSYTEVLIYWRNYYELESPLKPDNVFIVPCDRPDGQRKGALRWGHELVSVPAPELEAVKS